MKKARIKIVTELVVDINPEYYPEGCSFEDMLQIEKANAEEEPCMFMYMDEAVTTVEVVPYEQ